MIWSTICSLPVRMDEILWSWVKAQLAGKFRMKDLREVEHFLLLWEAPMGGFVEREIWRRERLLLDEGEKPQIYTWANSDNSNPTLFKQNLRRGKVDKNHNILFHSWSRESLRDALFVRSISARLLLDGSVCRSKMPAYVEGPDAASATPKNLCQQVLRLTNHAAFIDSDESNMLFFFLNKFSKYI